jgi:putative ABC transport system permease protein
MGTLLKTLGADLPGSKGLYRIIVRHKVSLANWIPEAYEGKLRQLPGVTEVLKMAWFGGMYVDHSARNIFSKFGVGNPEALTKVFDEASIVDGSEKDWLSDRTGALVGGVLMKKYGWKVGQKVVLTGDIYPGTYETTIRAVYKSADETGFYMHYKMLEETVPRAKGWVGWYWLKTDSAAASERLPKEIDALFENSDRPTRTETEKEFQNGFVSMLGNVKLILNGIATAVAFAILLVAANTMAMAARERVTEIAVLRTLGFTQREILGLVLGESVLLSLLGGGFGILVFLLLFPGLRQVVLYSPMGFYAAGMKIFPSVLATGFGLSVLVGLVSGLSPALRSARRSISDGLRQVA